MFLELHISMQAKHKSNLRRTVIQLTKASTRDMKYKINNNLLQYVDVEELEYNREKLALVLEPYYLKYVTLSEGEKIKRNIVNFVADKAKKMGAVLIIANSNCYKSMFTEQADLTDYFNAPLHLFLTYHKFEKRFSFPEEQKSYNKKGGKSYSVNCYTKKDLWEKA